MTTFIFTKRAKKQFLKIEKRHQDRIIKKLKTLKSHPDIFSIIKVLIDFEPATHRLRIGNYRLILKLVDLKKEQSAFQILDIGHRRNVYQ